MLNRRPLAPTCAVVCMLWAVSARAIELHAQGSVEQAFVAGAPSSASVSLFDAKRVLVQRGQADGLGGYVFRRVNPGPGYVIEVLTPAFRWESEPFSVLSRDEVPPDELYQSQVLPTGTYGAAGYGYLRTRDGTLLSVQVQLPDGEGPFPTLVEYSGYEPSNPASDDFTRGSVQAFRLLAFAQGYAYVGVNIRATGCSGGDFDYFERLQSLDGYDVIETVAAQPWVLNHRVGMFGISYPGISQLFVAQTRPPHLAAIIPLSVIDDTFRSTLYPGGIFNDGFALNWATDRQLQNRWPDPVHADWVISRVQGGDQQCLDNQMLRQQNPDLVQQILQHPFFPDVGDPDYPEGGYQLAPFYFVSQIDVPVFIAGAWQDEQTGGHWPTMLERFAPDVYKRVVATNGTHADSLGPEVLPGVLEFMDFFVARRVPRINPTSRLFLSLLYADVFGVAGLELPLDRFTGWPYEDALAAFQSEPPVTVLWENGAAPASVAGAPHAAARSTYDAWPPPETTAQSWFLHPTGRLDRFAPKATGSADVFEYDPRASPRGDFHCPGGEEDPSHCPQAIWRADAVYDWRPLPEGRSLAFISAPLDSQLTLLGSASADLWVATNVEDVDLQVTLTEVRPDGMERYVQNGWLRASHRALDKELSTELRPRHTHLGADFQPMPLGEFQFLRIELFPFAHVFRPGSRVRLSVEAPGGSRPLWTFADLKTGKGTLVMVGYPVDSPSRLVLPVVPNVDVPTKLPPCPSLRSQPCRQYQQLGEVRH